MKFQVLQDAILCLWVNSLWRSNYLSAVVFKVKQPENGHPFHAAWPGRRRLYYHTKCRGGPTSRYSKMFQKAGTFSNTTLRTLSLVETSATKISITANYSCLWHH